MGIEEIYRKEQQKLFQYAGNSYAGKIGREQAVSYINGLLSSVERKNGWQLSEVCGYATPYKIQQFLYRSIWDERDVCNGLQKYIKENLGAADSVVIADETGFLKKGTKSAGVKRQYSGTAGRAENCQVGVFLTYANAKGFSMIDRQLYLPKEWVEDKERCRKAMIPEETVFHTKPEMALAMMQRAHENGLPYAWVTADSVYGDYTDIRLWLEEQNKGYVMAVSGKAYVWQGINQHRISAVLEALDNNWVRLSCGEGSKGARLYDWKAVFINQPQNEQFERCLLVRKSTDSKEEMRAFICCYPKGTPLQKLVEIAGIRWTVERSFQETKGEVGLDHYEVRSYVGWNRHITLAMCAHALLMVIKLAVNSNESALLPIADFTSGSMIGFKKGRNLL